MFSAPWSVRSILSSLSCFHVFNRLKQCSRVATLRGVAALTCCMATIATAQTAHFSSVQSIVASVGQYEPEAVAVDTSGNVYIADNLDSIVYKETPSATGPYIRSTVARGLGGATALALDRSGNIYVGTYNQTNGSNSVLVEKPSGSGYVQSTVASGLGFTSGIAVDGTGNVYIAVNSEIFLEMPTGQGYTQSIIVTGLGYPYGIAVDGSGNIYVAVQGVGVRKEMPSSGGYTQSTLFYINDVSGLAVDASGNLYVTSFLGRVFKETLSGGTYTQSTIGSGLIDPLAVAVDAGGVIYIADLGSGNVLKEHPSGGNFGTVSVGSPSTKMSWIFAFDTAGTIGTPVVQTQGSTGTDFADARSGSCTTNGTTFQYNVGDSCTVDVVFTPTTAGIRTGSVQLVDNSGKVISTGSAQGVGQANGVTLDFTITSPGTGTPSVTTSAGGQAVYPFVISPTGSTGMPGTVSLSVTGLPTGASAVFSPSTVSAGAAATNVILLVNLPSQSAAQPLGRFLRGGALPVAFALVMLPLACSWRKAARRMNRMVWAVLLSLSSIAIFAGLTGCGGSSSSSSNSTASSVQTYSLTITATSGSLSHSTAATLSLK